MLCLLRSGSNLQLILRYCILSLDLMVGGRPPLCGSLLYPFHLHETQRYVDTLLRHGNQWLHRINSFFPHILRASCNFNLSWTLKYHGLRFGLTINKVFIKYKKKTRLLHRRWDLVHNVFLLWKKAQPQCSLVDVFHVVGLIWWTTIGRLEAKLLNNIKLLLIRMSG